MSDETPNRSAESPDGRGRSGGGDGEQSPLQARAAFLKNRNWESVVSYNRGACARGSAQHGPRAEAFAACERDWEERQAVEVTFLELLDSLQSFHRQAPFLFFNGNTFADVARQIATAIFAELPTTRRREVISAVAHYVAGVLDRESMAAAVESLWRVAQIGVGNRVKTLRGSLHGVVVRLQDDGRVVWRAAESGSELVSLPESLSADD